MKTITPLMFIVSVFILCSCDSNPRGDQSQNNEISKARESSGSETDSESIFKKLSDRVEKIDSEKGLNGLLKDLKKEDGSNVYDDVLKEIAKEDAESNGQVSKTIDFFIKSAEKHMGGQDFAEVIGDAIENMNDYSAELESEWENVLNQVENSGHQEDIPEILEGLNDFIKTGGENGGIEKIMEVVIKKYEQENYGDEINPLIEKMKEIVNNDELSAEKEATDLLEEFLRKSMDEMEQARIQQNRK